MEPSASWPARALADTQVPKSLEGIPWRVALPRFGEWLWNAGKVLVTFHLVVLAWVFFRAESMKDALYILRKIAKQPFKGPALTYYFGLHEALIALGAACDPHRLEPTPS